MCADVGHADVTGVRIVPQVIVAPRSADMVTCAYGCEIVVRFLDRNAEITINALHAESPPYLGGTGNPYSSACRQVSQSCSRR